MSRPVNLARRPFANTRPVLRVTAVLWLAGGLLTLANAWLYWGGMFGLEDRREQATELARQIGGEERQRAAAESELREMGLQHQNLRTHYLNQRIAERTFPWSRLFDDLADVLPPRVRLMTLAPQISDRRAHRSLSRGSEAGADEPRRVHLQMRGAAEEDDVLLDLLDRLFASSLFERPSLPRESRQAGGGIHFELGVEYLPERPWRVEPTGAGIGPSLERLSPDLLDRAAERGTERPEGGPEDVPTPQALVPSASTAPGISP